MGLWNRLDHRRRISVRIQNIRILLLWYRRKVVAESAGAVEAASCDGSASPSSFTYSREMSPANTIYTY